MSKVDPKNVKIQSQQLQSSKVIRVSDETQTLIFPLTFFQSVCQNELFVPDLFCTRRTFSPDQQTS